MTDLPENPVTAISLYKDGRIWDTAQVRPGHYTLESARRQIAEWKEKILREEPEAHLVSHYHRRLPNQIGTERERELMQALIDIQMMADECVLFDEQNLDAITEDDKNSKSYTITPHYHWSQRLKLSTQTADFTRGVLADTGIHVGRPTPNGDAL